MRLFYLSCFVFYWTFLEAQTFVDSLVVVNELSIHFQTDADALEEEYKPQLLSLISNLDNDDYFLRSNAHTDSDGPDEYNLRLSERRNQSVIDFLINADVPAEKIIRRSHGEMKLLKKEINESDKHLNRRVTLEVLQTQKLVLFRGIVFDKKSKSRIPSVVTVTYDSTYIESAFTSEDHFVFYLPLKKQIEFLFESKNYIPQSKKLTFSNRSRTDNIKIFLDQFELNTTITTNIQFIGGKSIILDKSLSELQKLNNSLLANEEICVELQGHIHHIADKPVPLDSEDHGLSIARSFEIFLYLVKRGVSPDRLLTRGYGNQQMIYPNARSEHEASANRRVVLKRISCDSSKMLKNEEVKDLGIYRYTH